ncbi:Phosphoadenosine phosphosulfate reductase [Kingella potus]|uniref:Adenosine 5'-phosphosulfate reductase n=1 Tax=Kingella potus TaxID=265175 RepID=A0A377R4U4_9NEIS|nr:phosphoadenylyl-sulfate reductase [Kingella potus]UOP00069.1 phosphoadenylyl-sulfate reductase [Kingella potus]STR03363.1 Phosphoadenosine phosphosulfate reductase [Kingella potus]
MLRPQLWTIPAPPPPVYDALDAKTDSLRRRLIRAAAAHQNVKLASSLAVEDMAVTHIIAEEKLPIAVFTLQTGRLNAETLALIDEVQRRYPDLDFRCYTPDAGEVSGYVARHGANAFYDSVELRRECCRIRKIEPLNRALADADAWLTGQRRGQSVTRSELAFAETDTQRGIAKYNPIFDWTENDVWAFVLRHEIPYNALYRRGYPSIGCEPCTMPVKAGEDIRAGRWWWESRDSKECGLHK